MSNDSAKGVDVSIIIVNYNTAQLLDQMWGALMRARHGLSLEAIVVDNASRDNSLEVLRRDISEARLIVNAFNVGFGRANNQAALDATGRYVLLLNTDAFVFPDTLEKTVAYMDEHLDCGILGVRLLGRDGALQPSCRYFPTAWSLFLARTGLSRYLPKVRMVDDMAWDHASVRECDWVPGCYYLVRREVIAQVGLFDPRYFLYYEEVDHCRRAKGAGWKVIYFPHANVVHLGGESAKSEGSLTAAGRQISSLQIESELLYFRKHHGLSGVMKLALLSTLGDLVLGLKALARRRTWQNLISCWEHACKFWAVAVHTRLGGRATR